MAMGNRDPLETSTRLLTAITQFCENNDPRTLGVDHSPEVVADVMRLWGTTNALSEVFARAWRIDRGDGG